MAIYCFAKTYSSSGGIGNNRKESLCNNCNLCVDNCPVNALEDPEIKQQSCWDFAFGDDEEEQVWRIACHRCRDICPYNLGSQNSILRKNN